MKSLSVVLNNDELSHLYGVMANVEFEYSINRHRKVIYEWKNSMSVIYNKHQKMCMVFNSDEIDLLFNILERYTQLNANYGNERNKFAITMYNKIKSLIDCERYNASVISTPSTTPYQWYTNAYTATATNVMYI